MAALPPERIRDACASAYLALLCEARAAYTYHTSDVRVAKEPAMGLALARRILRDGERALYPLSLDAVIEAYLKDS